MYICENCNGTFADPATVYDDIGYKYSACPYCEDDRISETEPCKQCSELKPRNHEDYCDNCKDAVTNAIHEFISDMVVGEFWDRELVVDMMGEIAQED